MGILRAWRAASFDVWVGRAPRLSKAATGVQIHSGTELDLCHNDIALLQISPPLSLRPLPMRLDTAPTLDDSGRLVGWGSTEQDLETQIFPRLTSERRRRSAHVVALGEDEYEYALPGGEVISLAAASFVGLEGACVGDSGAPFISEPSGAVIGVVEAMQGGARILALGHREAAGGCLGASTIFQRLDLQRGWIREVFSSARAALWEENAPEPAPIGSRCSNATDCLSGLCVTAGSSNFCSQTCADAPCPDGLSCVGDASERLCSIEAIAGVGVSEEVGCGLVANTRGSSPLLPFALVSVIGVGRRRRAAAARQAAGAAIDFPRRVPMRPSTDHQSKEMNE